jgi:hypothetical protein
MRVTVTTQPMLHMNAIATYSVMQATVYRLKYHCYIQYNVRNTLPLTYFHQYGHQCTILYVAAYVTYVIFCNKVYIQHLLCGDGTI